MNGDICEIISGYINKSRVRMCEWIKHEKISWIYISSNERAIDFLKFNKDLYVFI
jgi:hypothetical protein